MYTNNLSKITFIKYKNNRFQATILLKTKEGIIPYFYENITLLNHFPHLSKKIKEGKTLYIDFDQGYIGIELREGPYGEQHVFETEYAVQAYNLNELLSKPNGTVKNGKQRVIKLTQLGERYIPFLAF